jgi:low affinity Fe/Cu permease
MYRLTKSFALTVNGAVAYIVVLTYVLCCNVQPQRHRGIQWSMDPELTRV